MKYPALEKILAADLPTHEKDDLLHGITFEELITTVQSNVQEHSPQMVQKEFEKLLAMKVQAARDALKQNMDFILKGI